MKEHGNIKRVALLLLQSKVGEREINCVGGGIPEAGAVIKLAIRRRSEGQKRIIRQTEIMEPSIVNNIGGNEER
jgi:hypothetical protein